MKLICACCGDFAPAQKQWFNQDTGYGICAKCFARVLEQEQKTLGLIDGLTEALKSYGRPGVHHSLDETPSLFHYVLTAGIPYASHETDLYIPANDRTRKILAEFPTCDANKTTFENQVEGGTWFDVPFAYLPAWWAKSKPQAEVQS